MKLLNDNIALGMLTLQVEDINLMTSFYSEKLGLQVKERNSFEVILGTQKKDLIRLITSEGVVLPLEHYSGLYHTAFLLPESNDLLAMIQFLQKNDVAISGAADHLFSEAIYLNDPEGNGIEIYIDRPRDEWVVDDVGELVAASNPLNVDALINNFDGRILDGFPQDTIIGHIHLSLKDFDKARHFYLDLLGFEVQTDMGSAVFIAKDGYHHHIAFNAWNRLASQNRPSLTTGLVSFEIIVDNLEEIINNLQSSHKDYKYVQNEIRLDDGHGIEVILKEAYDSGEHKSNH